MEPAGTGAASVVAAEDEAARAISRRTICMLCHYVRRVGVKVCMWVDTLRNKVVLGSDSSGSSSQVSRVLMFTTGLYARPEV